MFPDRAALYITAIEDRQYKDFKIHCEYVIHISAIIVAQLPKHIQLHSVGDSVYFGALRCNVISKQREL